jgi:hypothetical protein
MTPMQSDQLNENTVMGQKLSYELIYRAEKESQQPSEIRVYREPHPRQHSPHLEAGHDSADIVEPHDQVSV